MTTPHRVVNPAALSAPRGFSHAVVAASGRTVYLAGQAAHLPDGRLSASTISAQFDVAAGNVVRALTAAGGRPEHVVFMQIFTTDVAGYRAALKDIGVAYRRHFGDHFPAVALLEVSGLFDPLAKVELQCVAVIPEA